MSSFLHGPSSSKPSPPSRSPGTAQNPENRIKHAAELLLELLAPRQRGNQRQTFRTKPGPAAQKTQWVSAAGPLGSPGCPGAALLLVQSSKAAKSAAPTPSAESRAPDIAPEIAKAMPCMNRA